MTDAIPTDSLMRFLQATPEQRAAIDRFLLGGSAELDGGDAPTAVGCGPGSGGALRDALVRIERKVDAIQSGIAGVGTRPSIEVNGGEAGRVFVLLKRLESGPKQRKAPLGTVFRLTVLEGRSQRKTARLCGCVPPLISRRVKAIESRFEMSIEQLRNFASSILEMESSVKEERYRKRKHGAAREERPQCEDEDGPGRADLVEDAGGYLPEERADYGD